MKRSLYRWRRLLTLLSLSMFLSACRAGVPGTALDCSRGIRVQGPGAPLQLEFACCDQGLEAMQALFDDPGVLATLEDLHAQVAVAISDFSPQRAELIQRLHRAGIPVIAWFLLSTNQGYYLNADNAPAAAARVADFEQWTRDNNLQWAGVGLDIEPNYAEFSALRKNRWHLIRVLVRNGLDSGRILRARRAYAAIVAAFQAQGYAVQTYEMPYVPAERSTHSSLLDRLLGTVEVRGNEQYLMLYTSAARGVGAGMIWTLGPHAQAIAIGSTDGASAPGSGSGPLDWTEFSTDLIAASHFTRHIGVYDLEGCVRQGFLPRLVTMNWSQSVVIPAESVRRAQLIGFISRSALWISSNFLYFLPFGLLLIFWLARRRW